MPLSQRRSGGTDSRAAMLLQAASAALAGSIAPLGWAPLGWWPVALAAYAALFVMVLRAATPWHAGGYGALFGLGLHLCGHGWIAEALHRHAGLGPVAAALGTLLVAGWLALFTALPCGLARACAGAIAPGHPVSAWRASGPADIGLTSPAPARWTAALAFAGLLTAGEWARSLCFNGYTSLSLGYALVDTWLAGTLPVGGLYLASWTGLLASAALALSWLAVRDAARPLAAPAGLLLLLAVGGLALQRIGWVAPDGPPLGYRLIQSNLDQAAKFDPLLRRRHVAHLLERIEAAPADLIVTAETAFPLLLGELPTETLPRLQDYSRRSASHVFAGIATLAANADAYNSIVQFAPQGTLARYDKVRLMPFGEYSPAGFGWFTSRLAIPMKDLSAGPERQPPFAVVRDGHEHRIGTLVCHEDLIGRDARARAASSGLLINPSNLAWFDGSIASAQRLQIARVRALETGRPLLRVANTGITAQIDADGRVHARLAANVEGVLAGSVQPMQGSSPYLRFGDAPALVLCALGLLPAAALPLIRAARRRSARRGPRR